MNFYTVLIKVGSIIFSVVFHSSSNFYLVAVSMKILNSQTKERTAHCQDFETELKIFSDES